MVGSGVLPSLFHALTHAVVLLRRGADRCAFLLLVLIIRQNFARAAEWGPAGIVVAGCSLPCRTKTNVPKPEGSIVEVADIDVESERCRTTAKLTPSRQ
jgi:hypothetical protein